MSSALLTIDRPTPTRDAPMRALPPQRVSLRSPAGIRAGGDGPETCVGLSRGRTDRSRAVPRRRTPEGGVALLEALLAIVILSIGLLGVIALQVRGLHNAHSAHQRTLASIIATDAGERLWIALAEPPAGATTEEDILAAVTAEWLGQWQAADPTLPNLDGEIDSDPASVDIQHYVIEVRWTDPRFDDDDGGEFVFVYRASLPDPLGD